MFLQPKAYMLSCFVFFWFSPSATDHKIFSKFVTAATGKKGKVKQADLPRTVSANHLRKLSGHTGTVVR